MNNELQVGDIIYVVHGCFLDILEVEKITNTAEHRDRMICAKCISRLTSKAFVLFLPENVKTMSFIERGIDIITCEESIAITFLENNIDMSREI